MLYKSASKLSSRYLVIRHLIVPTTPTAIGNLRVARGPGKLDMTKRYQGKGLLSVMVMVCAIALYGASYYVLVRPEPIDVSPLGGERYVYAHYTVYDGALQIVFYPANQLDRVTRRELWWTDTCTRPGNLSYVRTRE